MSSDGETPKLKRQGSKQDTTISSIVNIGSAQENLQVFNDRKVLMIYASGATAAEGEVNESHMTVMKGRLEQRLKNISFLCDLEYKQYILNHYTLKYRFQYCNQTLLNKSYLKVQILKNISIDTIIKMDVQQLQYLNLEEEQSIKLWNWNKQPILDKPLMLIPSINITLLQFSQYLYSYFCNTSKQILIYSLYQTYCRNHQREL